MPFHSPWSNPMPASVFLFVNVLLVFYNTSKDDLVLHNKSRPLSKSFPADPI